MSGDPLILIVPFLGITGLFDVLILYGAYLSLSVWRGLAVPLYRSRALWMALFGIPLVIVFTYRSVTLAILSSGSPLASPITSEIMFTFPLITLFAWIDRLVSSVIRLDYLRRDVLAWKTFRRAYWASVAIGNLIFFSRYLLGSFLGLVALPFIMIPLVYGSLALFKGTRATRDMTFRAHVKWFGYLGTSTVPALLIYGLTSNPILASPFVLIMALFYYKMSRFLVPIGRISTA